MSVHVYVRSLGGDLLFQGPIGLESRSIDVAQRVCEDHPHLKPGPRYAATLVNELGSIPAPDEPVRRNLWIALLPDQTLIEAGILDGAELTLIVHAAPIALASTSRGFGAWNAQSGRILWHIAWDRQNELFIPSRDDVRLSPDGSRVLIRICGHIRVLDSSDGRLLQTWSDPDLYDAIFQDSGESVATIGRSLTIRDIATGHCISLDFEDRNFPFRATPLCIASSWDKQRLVGTVDGAIYWRGQDQPSVWLNVTDQPVRYACFSPDDRRAVIGGDCSAILLDLTCGRVLPLASFAGAVSLASPPVFSLDGALLFSIGADSDSRNSLSARFASTGERSWTYFTREPGHAIDSFAPLPDSRLAICESGLEGAVVLRICDIAGTIVAEAEYLNERGVTFPEGFGRCRARTISPSSDGTSFLLQDWDTLSVWSVDPLRLSRTLDTLGTSVPCYDSERSYCAWWHRLRAGKPYPAAIRPPADTVG